ncbi:MAG: N-methyl-L-tryptophan oxidase [Clostridiales bacterium]|nr:N-methyl-L-tryptophan oxidase [Clostridiales bacterium]
MRDVDFLVVGLGAVGSATLRALAQRGRRVLGLDPHPPGHIYGSSHGESRIIRTAYYEDPLYVPLAQRAWQLWEEAQERARKELLLPTGALMIGKEAGELVPRALESARAWSLPHELLTPLDVARRFPAFRIPSGYIALLEPKGGVLFPERALVTWQAMAREEGAEIHIPEKALSFEEEEGAVRVHTDQETYRAARLILAAGAWMPKLLPGVIPWEVERQVLHWWPLAEDPSPYHPSLFPVFMWERDEAHTFYGFPTLDGETVKFSRHHGGQAVDPDSVPRDVIEEDRQPVAEGVAQLLPGLQTRPQRSSVCLYTNTPDHHFVLGLLPGSDRIFLASPCSGHGFKFMPALGEIMALLAEDKEPPYDLRLFAPERFRPS